MAQSWKGAPVAAALSKQVTQQVNALKEHNIVPTLAIIRIGERPDDLSYERGALKRCSKTGINVLLHTCPANVSQSTLLELIDRINAAPAIHGCLILRPLPPHLDEHIISNALSPDKDVDGITNVSMAGVFSGTEQGFAPCTAEACIALLDHYNYDLDGRKVTIIGRSLVIGKPVALMLLSRHATITICHTHTADLPAACRQADLLILASGQASMISAEYVVSGQSIVDVGISVDPEGHLVGDADFDVIEPIVSAITPVPGGIGAITTSVLAEHVARAAARLNHIKI